MLKLIAFSHKEHNDISADRDLPENRKKSANMVMASAVVRPLLEEARKKVNIDKIDFLFCSGEGEIHQTFEYFKFLAQNHARPILFQNSLHNSTLGALSLEVPGIASGITVSSGDLSFESALDVALSSPSALPVLILGVDFYNDEVQAAREKTYPVEVEMLSGGCAALFIPDTHPDFAKLPGPVIKDIRFSHSDEKASFKKYYPANGMVEMARKLSESTSTFSLIRPYKNKVTVVTRED